MIGAYCEDKIPNDNKIVYINLFDYESTSTRKVNPTDIDDYVEIQEESDYVDLVKKVLSEPDAPTGNVCDYVQEIGRAARRPDLEGEAYYHYNSRDFKFINQLHGLSTIKKYQLIEVVKKIDELYQMNLTKNVSKRHTKKRNAMLIDAENFTYIFDNPVSDVDDSVNKVKTALLQDGNRFLFCLG